MGKIKAIGKKVAAGVTVASLSVGGYVGFHFARDRANAGAHGAIVNLGEENGMLITDIEGKPAFFNYFGNGEPSITVSVTTTDAMPASMRDHLGQLTKFRQEHVSSQLEPKDFRGIDPQSVEVIRYFFKEFEELTGVHVNVTENSTNADIVIGGYAGEHDTIGYASFPQEVPELRLLPQNRGYMLLSTEYLKKKLEEGNVQAIQALVAHEFGHNLGLYHPHNEKRVETAMNDLQQDSLSRMSYNDMTFPPVATTEIDAGYGPLDIYLIRHALTSRGIAVPVINPENTSYLLSELRLWQMENTVTKNGGKLEHIPSLSIVDNGGRNELVGTDGDDLLVTQSGYCGLLDRKNDRIEIAKDGQPFCLVEGEFSLVKAGDGNDLILTADGTEQVVYTGTGSNQVALLNSNIGAKVIITPERQEPPKEVETPDTTTAAEMPVPGSIPPSTDVPTTLSETTVPEAPPAEAIGSTATTSTTSTTSTTVPEDRAALAEVAKPSDTALTLHYSLFERGDVSAIVVGDDLVLQFHAFSGRLTGQVTLIGQQDGFGIDRLRIIDNSGNPISEQEIPKKWSAEEWQIHALNPATIAANRLLDQNIKADLEATRQAFAGEAGAWTYRDEENESPDSSEMLPGKHASHDEKQPVSFEAYLRRREEEEAADISKPKQRSRS